MLAPSRGTALRQALASSPSTTVPAFLVPALQSMPRRQFSATPIRPSKLGRTPLSIPPGVEVLVGEPLLKKDPTSYLKVYKRTVSVTGPLGKLELEIEPFVKIEQDAESSRAILSVEDSNIKEQREMWGTTWAYLQRYIMGVSEGHTALLRLVGIGYRASVEKRSGKEEYKDQDFLCLKLGFTHPVEMGIPKGVKVTLASPTRILLEGIDREEIMSFAGRVRKWRPPEPYKGKGVFINDQTIKLKQKKIK
ncbi:54S ribosomal protein L6 [Colletotrichum siamense]|uniref:54S ribosomal protein L6 n=1 Tax=Colletotrichum siamense TaxID=690259 RepID=A0A9P5BP32_COLSI|nr:54S ribosomal protein L6 [Colletotrichum siamense]KAF4818090.1 54S ribosomal protein L6 [Colletotrichum tropicale]KAI8151321.1 54S ribosomal protein L6 [Colletotrichum sp. SAR 10_70]KAI8152336.1 54S ribosomal protein L6 [Colletotrichum sp. SAR 10_65]KAI8158786.1 54S ribosomal protein L6 [Colletotrichum sp. SAR 10_71]KAI8178361.1 54S ribosomal protein L6 [Colletotrichum sp. SAR 10_75]KAI8202932.1 54S ribosomal protein L6 [Colletotrichum sp. SAR 10_76]KAI8216747.1 54S ribosomal protein L6 [